ncbi:MAG: hypothetical protein ACLTDM_18860 [Clostridium butyricum]
MYNPHAEYLKMVMTQLSALVFNSSQITDEQDTINKALDSIINQIENYNRVTGENIEIVDYRKKRR